MRKFILMIVGAVLTALLLAACGGSGGSDATVNLETTDQADLAACEGPPVKGGTLVYARQYETVTLNPWDIKNGAGDIFAYEMIYSTLVRLDPEGGDEVVPGLAESWDVSDDGKTYTFHLRPGLKFSDGSPITAEDVRWSLEQFGDPKVNEIMAILATGYDSARVVDERTVEVKLTEPIAAFIYNVAEFPAAILPKKLVEKEGDAFWKHPVGSGPFKLREFVPGSHLVMDRNPHYWEKDKPYLDSVRYDFAEDGNSRVLSLKSGQAQIADGIPFSQIPALQSDPNIVIQTAKVPAWILMTLNTEYKPLGDVNVRRAMNYALNREQINQAVFKGVGTIPNSIFGELKFDSDSVEPIEFNLAKAKEYMAKSKFPDGFSLKMIYASGFDFFKQMTLLIAQQLKEIGINVQLEEQPAATLVERWSGMEYQANFPFPITASDSILPDEYAGFYALPSSETDGFYTGWSDPEIAKKVKKFQSTLSEEERAKQWPVIQRELLEQVPSINVMNLPFINAHAPNVCGTAINGLGLDSLQLTWLAKG